MPIRALPPKNDSVADDIYHNLLRILRYESKDTTYKFALLRGLIEISSESPHLISGGCELISAPFGLLVEKWVQYYWPIVEQDIPQKHGGEKSKLLAFRGVFKTLTDVYARNGGYAQFRYDYHNKRLTESDQIKYFDLLRGLRQTIAKMPMKYLGQSVFKGLYGIVKEPKLPRVEAPRHRELSPGWVVQHFGWYELRRDYHDAFQKIGGLLIGTDAILYHWADFTARLYRDSPTPEMFQKIFQTLTKTYEEDRQIKAAKQCYLDAMQREPIYCVWCGYRLSAQALVIDHLLPFSQTQNNSFWNLLPSCKKCNSSKSDSIATRETIERRKAQIIACWQIQRSRHPDAFEQEVRYDLVGFAECSIVAETSVEYVTRRCDFLIKERGYYPWEKS